MMLTLIVTENAVEKYKQSLGQSGIVFNAKKLITVLVIFLAQEIY